MQSFAFFAAIGHTCRTREAETGGRDSRVSNWSRHRPTDSPATIDVMRVAQQARGRRSANEGDGTISGLRAPSSPPDLLALVTSLMNHYGFVENVILASVPNMKADATNHHLKLLVLSVPSRVAGHRRPSFHHLPEFGRVSLSHCRRPLTLMGSKFGEWRRTDLAENGCASARRAVLRKPRSVIVREVYV